VDADTMGRSKYDPTRAEIERAGRMQQKAALQMVILLVAVCYWPLAEDGDDMAAQLQHLFPRQCWR
jgi:hypothetical protein